MEFKETKQNKWVFYLIIFGLVCIIVSMWTCRGNSETVPVTIPKTEGKTTIAKPEQKPIIVFQDSIVFKYIPVTDKKDALKWQNEAKRLLAEYNDLDSAFQTYNDSVQQAKYREAIEPNEFVNEWDNDTLYAKVYGFGRVDLMQLKYTIKARKQEVKVPQTVFRFSAGGGVGVNKEMNKGIIKANISGQFKKGNTLRLSYEKLGSQDFGLIEYDLSIFQIKR